MKLFHILISYVAILVLLNVSATKLRTGLECPKPISKDNTKETKKKCLTFLAKNPDSYCYWSKTIKSCMTGGGTDKTKLSDEDEAEVKRIRAELEKKTGKSYMTSDELLQKSRALGKKAEEEKKKE
mmetsp:Transcript_25824/g.26927  ORF Transcript_25824/g.26927 Transcript_25824/m.26927 type:complete len:126 (-) Transcript_25824:80-457(-)